MYPDQGQFYVGGSPVASPQGSRRKTLLTVGIVVILALVIVTIIVSILSLGDPGKKVADDFVKKYVASDIDGTYELLTLETQQSETKTSWATKLIKTKDFYSSYTYSELPEQAKTGQDDSIGVYRYIAEGRDGQYALIVTTKKTSEGVGVISFEANPYLELEEFK